MSEERREGDAGDEHTREASDQDRKLKPLQVISSVFAAGLGVQSSRNRERDFRQGNLKIFIAAGLVFTLLFIGTLVTIVRLVMRSAGH